MVGGVELQLGEPPRALLALHRLPDNDRDVLDALQDEREDALWTEAAMTVFEEQLAVALDVLEDNAVGMQPWALAMLELVAPMASPPVLLHAHGSMSSSGTCARCMSKSSSALRVNREVSWTGKGGEYGQAAWSDSSSAYDCRGMSGSGQDTESRPYAWDIEQGLL